jgi:hypothetical protein
VDIDSSICERELMQLHCAGVRGVRVNADASMLATRLR